MAAILKALDSTVSPSSPLLIKVANDVTFEEPKFEPVVTGALVPFSGSGEGSEERIFKIVLSVDNCTCCACESTSRDVEAPLNFDIDVKGIIIEPSCTLDAVNNFINNSGVNLIQNFRNFEQKELKNY